MGSTSPDPHSALSVVVAEYRRMTSGRIFAGALANELARTCPIGWIEGDPPATSHDDHTYDGRCAICRCADRPEALSALVAFVAATLAGPVCRNCECPIEPGETHRTFRAWSIDLPGSCRIDGGD